MIDKADYLYFRCEWVVEPVSKADISELLTQARSLGIAFFGEASHKNPKGYWLVPFIARVETKEVLNEFIQNIGQRINLDEWEQVFTEDWHRWHSLMISAVPDFMTAIYNMGQLNHKLRQNP